MIGENATAHAFFKVVKDETMEEIELLYDTEYCVKLSDPSTIALLTALIAENTDENKTLVPSMEPNP